MRDSKLNYKKKGEGSLCCLSSWQEIDVNVALEQFVSPEAMLIRPLQQSKFAFCFASVGIVPKICSECFGTHEQSVQKAFDS